MQTLAVCLLDDLLEFGGEEAVRKYAPAALPAFLRGKSSYPAE